jgi:hypothetical protein
MPNTIAIRAEDKNRWGGARPALAGPRRRVRREHGIEFASALAQARLRTRLYREAGATLAPPTPPEVVHGVKRSRSRSSPRARSTSTSPHHKVSRPAARVRRHLEQGATLLDYEAGHRRAGRRKLFYARFAGLRGGMLGLWARWASRLAWRLLLLAGGAQARPSIPQREEAFEH